MVLSKLFVGGLTVVLVAFGSAGALQGHAPTADEALILKVCEAVERVFQSGACLWPGYSLAEQPFVVYVPERWALLFNYEGEMEEFGPLPEGWPELGCVVRYHDGTYDGLVGQLAFYVAVGDTVTVAVGLPEKMPASTEAPEIFAYAYIVHEAFHQYQYAAFGEIPWAREELYPILEAENAALASLEVRILWDALRAVMEGRDEDVRSGVERFFAVRRHRWESGPPFVREYEQGLELLEGTAKYVELRGLEALATLEYASWIDGSLSPLRDALSQASMAELLIEEFSSRFGRGCVAIEDMARNRIYAVASSQGFLLDYLGVDWRPTAQAAGTGFTFVELLGRALGLNERRHGDILADARSHHDYAGIRARTEEAISEYLIGYREDLEAFMAQPGHRFEIEVSSQGITRSRTGRTTRWRVDGGARSLSRHYDVYTLRKDNFSLSIHDAGVMEEDDWEARRRRVIVFSPDAPAIIADGLSLGLESVPPRPFGALEVDAGPLQLSTALPGTLAVTGAAITISLSGG